eukprot:g4539.t1
MKLRDIGATGGEASSVKCETGPLNRPCQNGGEPGGTENNCYCTCSSEFSGTHCEAKPSPVACEDEVPSKLFCPPGPGSGGAYGICVESCTDCRPDFISTPLDLTNTCAPTVPSNEYCLVAYKYSNGKSVSNRPQKFCARTATCVDSCLNDCAGFPIEPQKLPSNTCLEATENTCASQNKKLCRSDTGKLSCVNECKHCVDKPGEPSSTKSHTCIELRKCPKNSSRRLGNCSGISNGSEINDEIQCSHLGGTWTSKVMSGVCNISKTKCSATRGTWSDELNGCITEKKDCINQYHCKTTLEQLGAIWTPNQHGGVCSIRPNGEHAKSLFSRMMQILGITNYELFFRRLFGRFRGTRLAHLFQKNGKISSKEDVSLDEEACKAVDGIWYSLGECSNESAKTESACTAIDGATWEPNPNGGVCSDSKHITKADCDESKNEWTPTGTCDNAAGSTTKEDCLASNDYAKAEREAESLDSEEKCVYTQGKCIALFEKYMNNVKSGLSWIQAQRDASIFQDKRSCEGSMIIDNGAPTHYFEDNMQLHKPCTRSGCFTVAPTDRHYRWQNDFTWEKAEWHPRIDDCLCNAGMKGELQMNIKGEYVGGKCEPVYCSSIPVADFEAGTHTVHEEGCHCNPGMEGKIIPTYNDPFYKSTCVPANCPAGSENAEGMCSGGNDPFDKEKCLSSGTCSGGAKYTDRATCEATVVEACSNPKMLTKQSCETDGICSNGKHLKKEECVSDTSNWSGTLQNPVLNAATWTPSIWTTTALVWTPHKWISAGYCHDKIGICSLSSNSSNYSSDCENEMACEEKLEGKWYEGGISSGCKCKLGSLGSIRSSRISPYYTGECHPVDCPVDTISPSEGTSKTFDCKCKPGFSGSIVVDEKDPYYKNSCLHVPCPYGTIGESVARGCICDVGYFNPDSEQKDVKPTEKSPFYENNCKKIPCANGVTKGICPGKTKNTNFVKESDCEADYVLTAWTAPREDEDIGKCTKTTLLRQNGGLQTPRTESTEVFDSAKKDCDDMRSSWKRKLCSCNDTFVGGGIAATISLPGQCQTSHGDTVWIGVDGASKMEEEMKCEGKATGFTWKEITKKNGLKEYICFEEDKSSDPPTFTVKTDEKYQSLVGCTGITSYKYIDPVLPGNFPTCTKAPVCNTTDKNHSGTVSSSNGKFYCSCPDGYSGGGFWRNRQHLVVDSVDQVTFYDESKFPECMESPGCKFGKKIGTRCMCDPGFIGDGTWMRATKKENVVPASCTNGASLTTVEDSKWMDTKDERKACEEIPTGYYWNKNNKCVDPHGEEAPDPDIRIDEKSCTRHIYNPFDDSFYPDCRKISNCNDVKGGCDDKKGVCENGVLSKDMTKCMCNIGYTSVGKWDGGEHGKPEEKNTYAPNCVEVPCVNGVIGMKCRGDGDNRVCVDRAVCTCKDGYTNRNEQLSIPASDGSFDEESDTYPTCIEAECKYGIITEIEVIRNCHAKKGTCVDDDGINPKKIVVDCSTEESKICSEKTCSGSLKTWVVDQQYPLGACFTNKGVKLGEFDCGHAVLCTASNCNNTGHTNAGATQRKWISKGSILLDKKDKASCEMKDSTVEGIWGSCLARDDSCISPDGKIIQTCKSEGLEKCTAQNCTEEVGKWNEATSLCIDVENAKVSQCPTVAREACTKKTCELLEQHVWFSQGDEIPGDEKTCGKGVPIGVWGTRKSAKLKRCDCLGGYRGGGYWRGDLIQAYPECHAQVCKNGTLMKARTCVDKNTRAPVECSGKTCADEASCSKALGVWQKNSCQCNEGFVGGGEWNDKTFEYPKCTESVCEFGKIVLSTKTNRKECECDAGYKGGGAWNDRRSYTANKTSYAFDSSSNFPRCVPVECPSGIIARDRRSCQCKVGFVGGGQWVEEKKQYPECVPSTCENGKPSFSDVTTNGEDETRAICYCLPGFHSASLDPRKGSYSEWVDHRKTRKDGVHLHDPGGSMGSHYPKCIWTGCPHGVVRNALGSNGDSKECICNAGYEGGGLWLKHMSRFPACTPECKGKDCPKRCPTNAFAISRYPAAAENNAVDDSGWFASEILGVDLDGFYRIGYRVSIDGKAWTEKKEASSWTSMKNMKAVSEAKEFANWSGTVDECKVKCAAEIRCVGFTYDTATKACPGTMSTSHTESSATDETVTFVMKTYVAVIDGVSANNVRLCRKRPNNFGSDNGAKGGGGKSKWPLPSDCGAPATCPQSRKNGCSIDCEKLALKEEKLNVDEYDYCTCCAGRKKCSDGKKCPEKGCPMTGNDVGIGKKAHHLTHSQAIESTAHAVILQDNDLNKQLLAIDELKRRTKDGKGIVDMPDFVVSPSGPKYSKHLNVAFGSVSVSNGSDESYTISGVVKAQLNGVAAQWQNDLLADAIRDTLKESTASSGWGISLQNSLIHVTSQDKSGDGEIDFSFHLNLPKTSLTVAQKLLDGLHRLNESCPQTPGAPVCDLESMKEFLDEWFRESDETCVAKGHHCSTIKNPTELNCLQSEGCTYIDELVASGNHVSRERSCKPTTSSDLCLMIGPKRCETNKGCMIKKAFSKVQAIKCSRKYHALVSGNLTPAEICDCLSRIPQNEMAEHGNCKPGEHTSSQMTLYELNSNFCVHGSFLEMDSRIKPAAHELGMTHDGKFSNLLKETRCELHKSVVRNVEKTASRVWVDSNQNLKKKSKVCIPDSLSEGTQKRLWDLLRLYARNKSEKLNDDFDEEFACLEPDLLQLVNAIQTSKSVSKRMKDAEDIVRGMSIFMELERDAITKGIVTGGEGEVGEKGDSNQKRYGKQKLPAARTSMEAGGNPIQATSSILPTMRFRGRFGRNQNKL